MGHNSLLGTEQAPLEAPGRDAFALGPSDSSDSGSDMMGLDDPEALTPGILPDAPRDGADISVDHVFTPGHRWQRAERSETGQADEAPEEDPDLAFVDAAQAGDPLDEEDPAEIDDTTQAEELQRLEAHRRAELSARAATTLPGKHPNPEPDPREPVVPSDDEDAQESESDEDEDHRPGRASALNGSRFTAHGSRLDGR